MKIQSQKGTTATAVKVGVSRQVVIPKKLHDELRLTPGDYLEVAVEDNRLVFTPKTLIDKRLAEGLQDFREGRTYGPFASARGAIRFLHSEVKKREERGQACAIAFPRRFTRAGLNLT